MLTVEAQEKQRGRPKKVFAEDSQRFEYTCAVCGTVKQVDNKYRINIRKYCSISCANKARAQGAPKKKPRPKAKNREIVCVYCGVIHMVTQNNARRGAKFCSNRCQMLYRYKDHIKYRTRNGVAKPIPARHGKRQITQFDPNQVAYKSIQIVSSLPGEQWIKFYSARLCVYYISNMGRVKSRRTDNGMENLIRQQWLSHTRGVYLWSCCVGQRPGYRFTTHREVAKYFVPNPCGYKITEFIDGNPRNIQAANICWGRREVIGWTKDAQKDAFSDMSDGDEISLAVARYLWTEDVSHLEAAFRNLIPKLYKVIYNHIRKLTHHPPTKELIEDIVQETLIKAKDAIDKGKLRTPKNISGWFSTIARNTAVTYGKKNHHISVNVTDSKYGEEFSLYDFEEQDEFSYTPMWGVIPSRERG